MRRVLAHLFVTSALVSLSAFAFNTNPILSLIALNNCSAPALWSGVVTGKRGPTAGVWVAYACQSGKVHVHDVLAADPTTPLWSSKYPLSGETFAPSFGADGSVYATSTTEVVKFDLLNGTRLWTQDRFNTLSGSALLAADVVYVPHDGGYAVLNATTGYRKTDLSFISNLVVNGNYSAGLTTAEAMQFYVDGQPVSSPNLDDSVQAPTAANGNVFCASQVNQAVVVCVNTKKAPSYSYQFTLGTALSFAIAGDLVVGIDAFDNAHICVGGACWAMRSRSPYTFAAGVSAPPLPVPRNASSCVIFGAAQTVEDGKNWLVGFDMNGLHQTAQLKSMPVGLPAVVFDERSQTIYVAITTSDMNLYVYKV